MSFTNKVVVITGAASGIGAAIALNFAKVNANLCIIDVNEKSLLKVKSECEELNKSKVLEIVADLTKDNYVVTTVERALNEFGKIDVLVNCAGIIIFGSLQDSEIVEKLDKIMSINLRAVIAMTKQALPALIARKGSIINISSISSTLIIENVLPYGISKAGVTYFTKCAAFELARQGVRVNCISPGSTKTNLLVNAGLNEFERYSHYENAAEIAPLNKCVKPEEVAELAVYLASDKAASITGSDFVVDAGLLLGNIGSPSD